MVRKYRSTAWSRDFSRCVNSKFRDGGVKSIDSERANNSSGELITRLKIMAVYYDFVNFQIMVLGLEINCDREGKMNFLFFVGSIVQVYIVK